MLLTKIQKYYTTECQNTEKSFQIQKQKVLNATAATSPPDSPGWKNAGGRVSSIFFSRGLSAVSPLPYCHQGRSAPSPTLATPLCYSMASLLLAYFALSYVFLFYFFLYVRPHLSRICDSLWVLYALASFWVLRRSFVLPPCVLCAC